MGSASRASKGRVSSRVAVQLASSCSSRTTKMKTGHRGSGSNIVTTILPPRRYRVQKGCLATTLAVLAARFNTTLWLDRPPAYRRMQGPDSRGSTSMRQSAGAGARDEPGELYLWAPYNIDVSSSYLFTLSWNARREQDGPTIDDIGSA